jgi:hypothetical protein
MGVTSEILINGEVAATLSGILLMDVECERIVFGARAMNDGVVVSASDEDLEELIGFVAAEPTTRRTAVDRSVWTTPSPC